MQFFEAYSILVNGLLLWVISMFLFVNKDVMSALLIIECWWIVLYFVTSLTFVIASNAVGISLLPVIVIFAGLEIVLGFYFLYYI